MLKLIRLLDEQDSSWRDSSVFLLDNASYHRSSFLLEKIKLMKVPLFFLGPYQFALAPVENFFAYIKRTDLLDKD